MNLQFAHASLSDIGQRRRDNQDRFLLLDHLRIFAVADGMVFAKMLVSPVPHGKIRPGRDVREWLTAYAKGGGPHHHAICFGDATPRLRHAAALIGADYCEV